MPHRNDKFRFSKWAVIFGVVGVLVGLGWVWFKAHQAANVSLAEARRDAQLSWKQLTGRAFELYQQHELRLAIQVTQQAMQAASREFGPESLQAAESMGNLGALYRAIGKNAEAQPLLERARHIRAIRGQSGTPLGLQTELFFDEVGRGKAEVGRQQRRDMEFARLKDPSQWNHPVVLVSLGIALIGVLAAILHLFRGNVAKSLVLFGLVFVLSLVTYFSQLLRIKYGLAGDNAYEGTQFSSPDSDWELNEVRQQIK